MKIKTSRREAKETIKWLDLSLAYGDASLDQLKAQLIDEDNKSEKFCHLSSLN